MSHLPFIAAAYGLTIGATVALAAWCWRAMRSAEREAEALRKER